VALVCNFLHQRPGELTLIKIIAPLFFEDAMRLPQLIRGNCSGNVVGNVNVNLVAEEFYTSRVIAVNGAK
jgi:hypothetical protein